MAKKKQGYDARLDESLGERNRGKKSQSLASRRRESEGTEKSMGRRKYSAVSTMDKGNRKRGSKAKRVVNLGAGGSVGVTTSSRNSDLTPQHKRMAMGQKVPQGKAPVKMRGGGRVAADMAGRRGGGPRAAALSQAAMAAKQPSQRRPSVPAGATPLRMRGGGAAAVKKMKRGGNPGGRRR